MSLTHNPYYHHPQPAARQVADVVLQYIGQSPRLHALFEQGKMLGILIVGEADVEVTELAPRVHLYNNTRFLAAYSGIVNGLAAEDASYFVPPVHDLQNPDDFYLQKDALISDLNRRIADIEQALATMPPDAQKVAKQQCQQLKQQRRAMSMELQREIFSHFTFINHRHTYRNVIDIFGDAKRGLPPGGTGECAAPRLLHYAYEHRLEPIELVEFWYGQSPRTILRIHGHAYPSCIEKCSPLLAFMLPPQLPTSQSSDAAAALTLDDAVGDSSASDRAAKNTPASDRAVKILYQDEHLVVIVKPKGMLSVASKDPSQPHLEQWLHQRFPHVKGPMLAHRLDQATSGVMLAALDAPTHKALQQQFESKLIQKCYVATLRGRVRSRCGIVSLPLTVNPDDRPRQVVDWQFGKQAITFYRITAHDADATHLELYPLTGRTHQLRVHCASPFGLDAPIVGDALYDILDAPTPPSSVAPLGQCLQLHAQRITFTHPATQQLMTFSHPLRPD